MSVKYTIVERPNPQDREAPKKFYPSIQASGRMSLRQLSKRISQMCTVSSPDTLAVLESMLTIIPEELADGKADHRRIRKSTVKPVKSHILL
jgi:hypothetical protein